MATYFFFDESGNLDFSPNGSRYYFFGLLTTGDPAPLTVALTSLRYELLAEGLELENFHAAEDTQAVRKRVFERIMEVGGFDMDVLIADKRCFHPALHDAVEFYSCLANVLLDAVLRRHADGDERLVVITDRLPLQRHRKAAEKAFKSAIRNTLGDRQFSIVHHASSAHALLQVVDYCTWAVQRKWHRGDSRSFDLIAGTIRSIYEACGEDCRRGRDDCGG